MRKTYKYFGISGGLNCVKTVYYWILITTSCCLNILTVNLKAIFPSLLPTLSQFYTQVNINFFNLINSSLSIESTGTYNYNYYLYKYIVINSNGG